jgi:hypothetical protein
MTTDKAARISALILARLAAGATLAEAIDAVCGAGSHARLAASLWESFRAAEAAPVKSA